MITFRKSPVFLLFLLITSASLRANDPGAITSHDVIWNTPGKNSADSMPMGNGELGINLWVEENGDLLFYLGRNDAYSAVSQLCKVGCPAGLAFAESVRHRRTLPPASEVARWGL